MINKRLETILKEEMGLNVSSIGKSTLQNSVSRRMRAVEIEDTNAYLNLLQRSPFEINALVEEVAVNETWFFRDHSPFTVLGQYAVNWMSQHTTKRLKVLSIPCATGEEPYSIAITLLEAGLPEKNFKIDAVDISTKSLKIAEKAVYRDRSFRNINNLPQSVYFKKTHEGLALSESITRTVKFYKGNLINIANTFTFADYDIIFCRNLLIYIDLSYRQKALDTLDRLLAAEGLLFIGHAEAGLFTESQFVPTSHHKAFCFHKKTQQPSNVSSHKCTLTDPLYTSYSSNAAGLPLSSLPPPKNETLGDYAEIKLLYKQNKYQRAVEACEKSIKEKSPSSKLYYWLGLSLQQLKNYKTAVTMLKKSIYLNPDNIKALEQLSTLYKYIGDEEKHHIFQRRTDRVKSRLRKDS